MDPLAGSTIRCPECGGRVVVPEQTAAPKPEPPTTSTARERAKAHVKELVKQGVLEAPKRFRWTPAKVAAVYLAGLLGLVALLVGGYFIIDVLTWATVHIDNYSTQDVRLELDGQPWATAKSSTISKKSLMPGSYSHLHYPPRAS